MSQLSLRSGRSENTHNMACALKVCLVVEEKDSEFLMASIAGIEANILFKTHDILSASKNCHVFIYMSDKCVASTMQSLSTFIPL